MEEIATEFITYYYNSHVVDELYLNLFSPILN